MNRLKTLSFFQIFAERNLQEFSGLFLGKMFLQFFPNEALNILVVNNLTFYVIYRFYGLLPELKKSSKLRNA